MSILDECPGEGYKLCRKKLHWFQGERCRLCRNTRTLADYHKRAAEGTAWYQQNKEKHLANGKQQYQKNRNQRQEKWRKWREENLQYDRERNRRYSQKQKDVVRRKAAKRRANKKAQTPAWANTKKINQIYKQCPESCHVDHIYPLKSDYLCGLHVENNLQIIPGSENVRKGNRVWPGQLDCQKGSIYDIFPKELTNLLND